MSNRIKRNSGIIATTVVTIGFLFLFSLFTLICVIGTSPSEEIKYVLTLFLALVFIYICIISSVISQKVKSTDKQGINHFLLLIGYGSFLATQLYLILVIVEFQNLLQKYNGLELYLEFDRLWALLGVLFIEASCVTLFILVFKRNKILYGLLIAFIVGALCTPVAYGVEELYYGSIEDGVITQKTPDGYNLKLVSNSEDSGQVTKLDNGWYSIEQPGRTSVQITYPEKYNIIYEILNSWGGRYEEAQSLIFYYNDNTTVQLSKEWTNNVIFQVEKLTSEELQNIVTNLSNRYIDLSGEKTYKIDELSRGNIIVTKDNDTVYRYIKVNSSDVYVTKWILKDGSYEQSDDIPYWLGDDVQKIELLDNSFLLTPPVE